jgi:signal transduction histidine kinase
VIIVDPVTRKIENVNSHAATLFGAPEDQIVGRRCHSFLCPVQDGACPICDLDQVVDNSEKIMLRANGSRLPILKSVKRIQVQGREKLLECFVNITNHKRTEEDLRRAKQSLEQHVVALRFANQALEETSRVVESGAQAKGELLSNLSHEIRMTMTGILRYANRLLTEPGLEKAPTHRVEAFQTIAQNGRQLLTIIDNILDLSEIEARKLQVEWITCSLTSLLTEVVSLMQVQADAKGLPLILQYVGPVPETIHTDPARLRQILVNLIENAVKFTAAGEVRIVVRLLDGEGPTPKLACTVVDNGMGISPDQMKWLFEPFGQADAATNWNSNGTGLGLAVSKRLAELLDGEITVESVPGKGSSFTISLPIGSLMQVRMIEHSGNVAIPSVAQELPFSPGQPILTG